MKTNSLERHLRVDGLDRRGDLGLVQESFLAS